MIWEIFSGKKPYNECDNAMQCAWKFYKGEKLEIPSEVPADIKDLIQSCWATPCQLNMDANVATLANVYNNVDSIDYAAKCAIPTGLF